MSTPDPVDEGAPGVEVVARPARTQRRRKGAVARWLFLGAVVLAIALVGSTMRGSAFVYAKYVDEILAPAERPRWVGRTVRVEGLVEPGSIENRPGTNEYRFRVGRNHAVLPVRYRGIVPDTFRDCAGVTVRGTLGASGVFAADEIVAKCPSKYEAATVQNGECVVGVAPERGAAGSTPR